MLEGSLLYMGVVQVMEAMDDQGMLQQEQKEGEGEWSDLERFRILEVLDVQGFGKGKENSSLLFLSQYCSPFISYKYSSIISSKCKMEYQEQY